MTVNEFVEYCETSYHFKYNVVGLACSCSGLCNDQPASQPTTVTFNHCHNAQLLQPTTVSHNQPFSQPTIFTFKFQPLSCCHNPQLSHSTNKRHAQKRSHSIQVNHCHNQPPPNIISHTVIAGKLQQKLIINKLGTHWFNIH